MSLDRMPMFVWAMLVQSFMSVSQRLQGQGMGKGLLKDAIVRTLAAADIAGIRAFAVHAKNEKARTFHERFDFIPSPTDPLHMFVSRTCGTRWAARVADLGPDPKTRAHEEHTIELEALRSDIAIAREQFRDIDVRGAFIAEPRAIV